MPKNTDREDFLTDYDPNWGNDKEWDYDDDEPGRDVPDEDDDDEEDLKCPDCKCDAEDPDDWCQCPCHQKE